MWRLVQHQQQLGIQGYHRYEHAADSLLLLLFVIAHADARYCVLLTDPQAGDTELIAKALSALPKAGVHE